MPEESIWGKSAVDATRKNSLPQYIDDTIGEVKGQYVKKSGDTMTGHLIQRSGVIDINITPSSTQWDDQYQLKDKNGVEIGAIYAIRSSDDLLGIQMEVSRANLAGKRMNNNIRLYLNNDGVPAVQVSSAAAWRTALSVLPLSGGPLTGGLTISSGSLTVNAGGATINGGSIWAGTLSTAAEIDVGARANAGSIYLYSASTTNGNRGIWATNHGGTGHYFLYCTQDNLIHSNAYSTAVSGICVRDIQVQDSASNSVSTKYIIMKRG